AEHLARTKVEIETTFVDRRGAAAVMARSVGMGTKVDSRMESRQRDIVAAIEAAENLAAHGRIAGPDAKMIRKPRGDVVDHGGPSLQRSPTPAALRGKVKADAPTCPASHRAA